MSGTSDKKKKRTYLTIWLLMLLFGVLAVGIFGLFAYRRLSTVETVMPYDSRSMTYHTSDKTALVTADAFASDLCVGENDLSVDGLDLTGNAYGALFDVSNRRVVYAKGMHETIYPASITKLMTALLAYENGNMDDFVTISWEDLELESGSQVIGLKIGDQVKLKDLTTAMIVHSGNDAAQAIARHIAGSQPAFVVMMNKRARELGMTGTHFMNPSGLHDADHYTTVYDIYLMLNEISRYEDFINTSQIRVYELVYTNAAGERQSVTLDSTDRYVTGQVQPPKNVTILGGKTGTTSAAGNCLALLSQNAYGELFISIVVRAPDKDALYNDMNAFLTRIHS